jgi:hypothetical protein
MDPELDQWGSRPDGAPHAGETPRYVHRLIDSLLRHEPINFKGCRIPDDVRERLETYFAERANTATGFQLADTNEVTNLQGLLSAAVQQEFAAMGAMLGANDDFSWMRAGLGILAAMRAVQVGWVAELTDRAHMFVTLRYYPEAPDDGHTWLPVFAFGE